MNDPLPSWNEGLAKATILDFVRKTTAPSSPSFVRPKNRIAAFDQDGTTRVEQPMYTQLAFALDRLAELAPQLVYQPMLEIMRYFEDNGFSNYIVTGGGQAFVRAYAEGVYDMTPEQIIGSSLETQFEYDTGGAALLMRPPKLLLYNDSAGKPQDIYLFLGRPPVAAFGNSTGDQQMLEYTQTGGGTRLMVLVGAFTHALADTARANGWLVASMKNDWKRIFAFESSAEMT